MKILKVLGLATAIAFTGVSAHAETELKLAHAAPDTDLQQTLSIFFKEQVEARTNGSVKVTIFPQGQLGNDQAMIATSFPTFHSLMAELGADISA